MIGWSVPRRIGPAGRGDVDRLRGEPGRQLRCRAGRSPRSASAPSMATRTALAMAPTRGRSSAGSAPIPRRTPVRRPFLPRTSSSSASSAATSGAAAIAAERLGAAAPRGRGSGRRGPRSSLARPAGGPRNHEPSIVGGRRGLGGAGGGRTDPAVSGALGELDDAPEGRAVADGQVGQDLAVDLDVGLLEARGRTGRRSRRSREPRR